MMPIVTLRIGVLRSRRSASGLRFFALLIAASCAGPLRAELLTFPERPVDRQLAAFKAVVERIHRKAVRSRKPWKEEDLRKEVPRRYLSLEKSFEKVKDPSHRAQALAQLALIYADLAWVERIGPLRETVAELDRDLAARLGHFEESEHFLVRVVGTDSKWGKAALKLGEAARAGYVEVFGFPEISKVPGKKVRILIHVDPALEPRLYFHPTPLYHGEMRYEMPEEKHLTLRGKRRLVYGFCHELGHMVAMWGEYGVAEDDKHAWAHYTGCRIVEEVYERLGNEPWPTWTAFQRRASGMARLEKEVEGRQPGLGSYESILALFHTVGRELGTEAYGKSWEWLEKKRRFRRINNVPYLWMKDLREALLHVAPKEKRARVAEVFAGK